MAESTTTSTGIFFDLNCSSVDSNCTTDESGNVNLNADEYMNIIYTIIGIVGVAGNSLVASVLLYFKAMRKSLTNTFIINQCCIDGSASLCIILSVYIRDVHWISSSLGQELFCRLWLTNMPIWGIFVSSTYNMVAVTFERYSALVYPFSHHKYFTRRKALIIISVVWVCGPAFNAAYMIPTSGMLNGQCTVFTFWPSSATQTAVGILTVVLQYFIPLGLVIYAYARIAFVLTKAGVHSKENDNDKKKEGKTSRDEATTRKTKCEKSADDRVNKTRENRISKAKRNVIKTLALVSACFVFCWSWNQIFFTMYNSGYAVDFNSRFYHFTVIMVFCNCCLNPIIYAIKYEQFQRGLRKIVCRKLGRRETSTFNSMASHSLSGDSDQSERQHKTLTKVISDPTVVKSNNGMSHKVAGLNNGTSGQVAESKKGTSHKVADSNNGKRDIYTISAFNNSHSQEVAEINNETSHEVAPKTPNNKHPDVLISDTTITTRL